MVAPIYCETPGCPNEGTVINRVSNIPKEEIDLFYESYKGDDPADVCPECGQIGVLEEPEEESGVA